MVKRLAVIAAVAIAALAPSSALAQGIDQTCQASLTRLDATTTNALAVDTNAVYWVGGYRATPGTRIRIEGQYPYSRYMGFNVYDPAGRPIDSIADFELKPDKRSTNPFEPGADRFAERRDYTAFIEFAPRPKKPARNTVYSGDSPGGTFWYRVYIPDQGRDAKGGVPLPRFTVEPADGAGGALAVEPCRELQAPYLEGVNEAVASAPAVPDLVELIEGYPGRNPPDWRLFVNFSQAAVEIMFNNETGEPFHEGAQAFQNDGPGFFSARDISYVFTGTSRGFGDVLVLHGAAPTFADTRDGPATMPSGHELRYWSFCQYEPATQRVIDCRADDGVTIDPGGDYTVVVSTAEHRPANARPECGVTWLPWGPPTQGLLIYRHLLADPGFANAIQRVGEPGQELEAMGDYYPSGEYLADAEAFEARGCPASAPPAP